MRILSTLLIIKLEFDFPLLEMDIPFPFLELTLSTSSHHLCCFWSHSPNSSSFPKSSTHISPNFHVFLKMKSYSLTCSLTCIQNTGCWCSITSSGFTKLVIILPLFLCLTFMPICHAEVPFLPYLNISFICVSCTEFNLIFNAHK